MSKNLFNFLTLFLVIIITGCQIDKPMITEDIPQGNFTGKICNENGVPVKDAVVYLFPENYSALSDNKNFLDSTISNSSGMYGFDVHSSGKYNLLASNANRYAFKKSIPVNAGSQLELPEQRLFEAGSVSGSVLLQNRNNQLSAVILFPGTNIYAVPNDTSGTFLVSNLPQGTYTVRFLSMTAGFAVIETTLTVLSGKTTTMSSVMIPEKPYPVVDNFKVDYNPSSMTATLTWNCKDTDMIDSFRIYCNRELNIKPVKTVYKNTFSSTFQHISLLPDTFSYQISTLRKDGWEGTSATGIPFVNKSQLSVKVIPLPREIENLKSEDVRSCHINKFGFYIFRLRGGNFDSLEILKLDSNFNFVNSVKTGILYTMASPSVSSDNSGNLFIFDQNLTDNHFKLFKFDKDINCIDTLMVTRNDLLNYYSFAVSSNGNVLLYNTLGGPFQDYPYNRTDTQLTIVKVYDDQFNELSETTYNDRQTILDSWSENDITSAIIYSDSWSKNQICTFNPSFNCIKTTSSVEKLNNPENIEDYYEMFKTGFFTKNLTFIDFSSFPVNFISNLYIYDAENTVVARYPHPYTQFYPTMPGKAIYSNYNGTLYSFDKWSIIEYTIDTLTLSKK